jgi:hypothetical protein
LLVAIGLDEKHSFALKLGAAKPLGLGTVSVVVTEAEIANGATLKTNRYMDYAVDQTVLKGDQLKQAVRRHIAQAHGSQGGKQLVKLEQLEELVGILQFPTDREPMEGVY